MLSLRVTDLKQYFYCPRIIYYNYCLPVPRLITPPMQVGAVEHEVISVLERRRNLKRFGLGEGKRMFHVTMQSTSLGLTGVLDMLVATEERAFPVEFKYTSQPVNLNAKYQTVAYAMMVEEYTSKPVENAFIYRIPDRKVTVVTMSAVLRERVLCALSDIRELILHEIQPDPPNQRGKCVECEFRRYCRDII